MLKKLLLLGTALCLFAGVVGAEATTGTSTGTTVTPAAPKRPPIFRANKGQIKEAQKLLKTNGFYKGEEIGKLDPDTRLALKGYQKDNGLRRSGTLNRATLEKMGIELTDKQKLIPISPNSYASAKTTSTRSTSTAKTSKTTTTSTAPKRVIFRASADQIRAAQKLLKSKSFYAGDETGKLDVATRDGLKKFQDASGIKVTGTLNQITLEKMGIELTDKQKADAEAEATTKPAN